jgi:hypothetical protein
VPSNNWRRVLVTPLPDAFGKTLLTFTVSDGTNSASKTAVLTVTAVNDAPSFVLWTNRLAVPNQGITVTNQIILSASKGPANESAQILSYTIANPDPFFFALAPTLKPSGVLTFKPKTGVTGSVTLGITLKDTGGTLNGGVNTNGPVPLTIVITP